MISVSDRSITREISFIHQNRGISVFLLWEAIFCLTPHNYKCCLVAKVTDKTEILPPERSSVAA